jgi:hypothetical protein
MAAERIVDSTALLPARIPTLAALDADTLDPADIAAVLGYGSWRDRFVTRRMSGAGHR